MLKKINIWTKSISKRHDTNGTTVVLIYVDEINNIGNNQIEIDHIL
jgi:hypothetical protein